MAVATRTDRHAFVVTWDAGDGEGDVQLFFTSPDGDDVSNTDARTNDGEAVATVPADFSGDINVEVRASDGSVVDSGTITL